MNNEKISQNDNNNNVLHPGEHLKRILAEKEMSQSELSVRAGVTAKYICTLINGEKDISASFAKKLAYALDTEAEYWMKLQADFDMYQLRLGEANNVTDEEKQALKSMKEIIAHFVSKGFMKNNCGDTEKVLRVRTALCVSNLNAIPNIPYNAAYRAQVRNNAAVDPYVLFAWQRLCELETQNMECENELNLELLKSKLPEIRSLMLKMDNKGVWINSLRNIFASCGVAFAVVENFKGAPVQGFIKKSDSGKNILCLTIRQKRADIFWFTLFHEIGHLLNGDLSAKFVDFSSVVSDIEAKADTFAKNVLIPQDKYINFVRRHDYSNIGEIVRFSKMIGVPDYIVIGRLQKDELIGWSYFRDRIPNFEWSEG